MPPSHRARRVVRPGALVLLVLLAPLAGAHATLQSAEPPANGHADVGLTSVLIRFTEAVEPEYTSADISDQNGTSWAAGAVEHVGGNAVRLPTRPLEDGIYSVSWRALSIDTHTTRGAFLLAIGNATLTNVPPPAPHDAQEHTTERIVRDGLTRFAFYAGAFLAVGIPLFALVTLRDAPPRRMFATAAAFGAAGALGALVGLVLLADRTGLSLAAAGATAPGRSLAWRGALVALAALACALARPARWRAASLAAVALGAGALVATALGSHAAASGAHAARLVVADVVHLLTGAAWVGGIAAFLHVVPGRTPAETALLVARFTPLAIGSVVLLFLTGMMASAAHIPCVAERAFLSCGADARDGTYVKLVALKLALLVPLVVIGAYNAFRLKPALERGAPSHLRLRRILQAEAGIMAVVLLAAGVLAASAPPDVAAESASTAPPPALVLEETTQRSHVILTVTPSPVPVGIQKLVVQVHPLGPRLPNSTLVALKVWKAGEPEPDETLNPAKVAPGEWEIEESLFTSEGSWNVEVILQRPDEYVKIPFQVPVGTATPQETTP